MPGFLRGESFWKAQASVTPVTFGRRAGADSGYWVGTTPQVNLIVSPLSGNLLVALASHRDALATDPTITDNVGGTWTLRFSRSVDLSRTHDRRRMWVWSKIASGSETGLQYCTFASSVGCRFTIHEYTADTAFDFDFLGSGGADTGTGATTSEPTYAQYGGTSDPTISSAGFAAYPQGGKSLLRLSLMGARAGESGSPGTSWAVAGTNVEYNASGGYQVGHALAFAGDEVGGASLSDTLDWTSLYLQPSIAHLAFGA